MATALVDLLQSLTREVNTTGLELVPDVGAGEFIGYIEDGFWDCRLAGILSDWTVVDAADVNQATPPASGRFIVDATSKAKDLPHEFRMLVVIFAGARIIRNKILNLAINFSAQAGPVQFEQQASATTLRAVLDILQRRMNELKIQYSKSIGQSAFVYMDGVLQAEYASLNDLGSLTVIP